MTGTKAIVSNTAVGAAVVPAATMNRKIENFLFAISDGSVPTSAAAWKEIGAIKAPWACDVVAVSAWCETFMSGGSIDVFEGAASILSAPIDLSPAAHVSGTISDASIAVDADLSVRVLAEGLLRRVVVAITIAVD